MLLYLANYLSQFDSSFTVFNYITLRAVFGALTALIISFMIGPKLIEKLNNRQLNQPVRDDGPETHLIKIGTPTMGGALILLSISISTLLWSDLSNIYVWIVLFVTISFGLIGYIDDYKKIINKNILINTLDNYDEIILIGSGKGVASIQTISNIKWKRKSLNFYKKLSYIYNKEISKCSVYK